MSPGGLGYGLANRLVICVETVLALFGLGTLGEESAASGRIAAKRIARIAASLGL